MGKAELVLLHTSAQCYAKQNIMFLLIYIFCRDAFDLSYGVGVLRIPEGLDRNKVPDELLDFKEESDDEDFDVSDDGIVQFFTH